MELSKHGYTQVDGSMLYYLNDGQVTIIANNSTIVKVEDDTNISIPECCDIAKSIIVLCEKYCCQSPCKYGRLYIRNPNAHFKDTSYRQCDYLCIHVEGVLINTATLSCELIMHLL